MKNTALLSLPCFILLFIQTLKLDAQAVKGFGDSITKGLGVEDTTKTWLYLVAKETNSKYINYGVSSSTVYQRGVGGSNFINTSEYSLSKDPVEGYVTIMYGTNSDGNNASDEWKKEYKKIIKKFIDAGYAKDHIILCSPPWTPLMDLGTIPTAIKEVAEDINIVYADVFNYTKSYGEAAIYHPADVLHPNEQGHRLIANYVKALISPSTPLPVKFSLFTSFCDNGKISLTWKTAYEGNSQRFDVEKKIEGSGWRVIGSLAAAGTSNTERTYVFFDATPSLNAVYRIVEYDFDLKTCYSVITKSSCSVKEELIIWPNPAKNMINISLTSDKSKEVGLTLYNSQGILIRILQKELLVGNNQLQLELGNLPNGHYLLSLNGKDKYKHTKIIISK